MSELHQILTRRYMSEGKSVLTARNAATKKIESMKKQVLKGKDPEDLLYRIGLEPDYALDLLF